LSTTPTRVIFGVDRQQLGEIGKMRYIGLFTGAALLSTSALANPLSEPPELTAKNGKLEVLLVARPQQLPLAGAPPGYVYEACERPSDPNTRRCPLKDVALDPGTCPTATDPIVSPYGGVRLQLSPGDTLRVRLVNCLPPPLDAKHASESPLLAVNPTNLHTHGLIVEPRRADDLRDPFGDYIYVLATPAGTDSLLPLARGSDNGEAIAHDYARTFDYEIPLKHDHPSGLFWFHPHVHGLALNQISSGLAGIITVGSVHDYVCDKGATCAPGELKPKVRHLILKDVQITGGTPAQVRAQENPGMCGDLRTPDAAHPGACVGTFDVNTPGSQHGTSTGASDGLWQFTVNGQVQPEIQAAAAGEIWRIANASGSATYNLGVIDDATQKPIPFQVLALDGLSIDVPRAASPQQLRQTYGGRLDLLECPGLTDQAAGISKPICATAMRMMPSSRAEIWITHRDATGAITPVPSGGPAASAVLRSAYFETGPAGDHWPALDLAHVGFDPWPPSATATATISTLNVRGQASKVFSGPVTTRVQGQLQALPTSSTQAISPAMEARLKTLAAHRHACSALPAEKHRQILFGLPDPNSFGLGLRLVDGAPANKPQLPLQIPDANEAKTLDIKAFDHSGDPTVCLPLKPGNAITKEIWELVNLAGEDHNFHIHQTRFSLVSTTGADGQEIPVNILNTNALLDNVPVPHGTDLKGDGTGCDGTIDAWRAGTCKPSRVIVEIPFKEIGDFVYHCHILEHEDGGMMAKISVVPNGGS
jgi:FtsP/CotA-like multicopper oxidase with cupredoxin domain